MRRASGKNRVKEEGLVDIVQFEKRDTSQFDLTPQFIQLRVRSEWYKRTFHEFYLAMRKDQYIEYLQTYLHALYQRIKKVLPETEISFKINPTGLQVFQVVSDENDIILAPGAQGIPVPLNGIEAIANQRRDFLPTILGHKHNLCSIESTLQNTDIEDDEVVINEVIFRPICNNINPIGSKFGTTWYRENDQDSYHFHWELYYITDIFVKYLEDVHQIITGTRYDSCDNQVPLQISTYGLNISDSERRIKEDQIRELSEKYSGNNVKSKFAHSTVQAFEDKYFARHMDGSIFVYDFDTLRRRLYNWRDEGGRIDDLAGKYIKIFKIDIAESASQSGYILPIYSSLKNPALFDLHNLVDVFMAREML